MPKATVTEIEFEVKDRLIIGDPCYFDSDDLEQTPTLEEWKEDNEKHRLACLIDKAAGVWIATIEKGGFSNWGDRVSALRLRKKGGGASALGSRGITDTYELGVDSGQMYAGDADQAFGHDYNELLRKYSTKGYRGDNPKWGGDDYNGLDFFDYLEGVVSSTGFGDGSYPAIVKINPDTGKPSHVDIIFIPDGEEEEMYFDEEEEYE